MEDIKKNAPGTESEYLIEVRNLVKWFPIKSSFFRRTIGNVRAVDGISFHIKRGQTMGLVGESGCGKSTAGRTILRLIEKTSGEVIFDGQDKINSSIMLITHDLGVIASMADYVVVMYAGRVVEKGTTEDIFHNPCHPYTIGLMKSKPVVGKKVDALYNIPGSVPNPVNMPDYCYFRDRCEQCVEKCQGVYPPEIRLSDTHVVSCWRYDGQGEVVRWPKSVNVEEL